MAVAPAVCDLSAAAMRDPRMSRDRIGVMRASGATGRTSGAVDSHGNPCAPGGGAALADVSCNAHFGPTGTYPSPSFHAPGFRLPSPGRGHGPVTDLVP